MNYIGVDYHKKYSYMVVKNEDGQVEGRGTVNNTFGAIPNFALTTSVSRSGRVQMRPE